MKFILATILLLSSTKVVSQSTKPEILFPSKEDTVSKAKSIKELRQKAAIVFAYRTYTTWNDEPYNIIAVMKDNSIESFKFSLPNFLVRQNENVDTLKHKMSLVYSYDLFSMTKTDNWMESCDNNAPSCGDCKEYDFVLMTNKKVKRLYFYVPTLYVDYCKSVKDNKRIIEFIKRLWN